MFCTVRPRKKRWKKWLLALLIAALLAALFVLVSNLLLVYREAPKIVSAADAAARKNACILILGCGITDDGRPKPMLADRLDTGIRLWQQGAAPKILVSGDHGRTSYDEVNTMKQYLIDAGIPDSDIFMDHAGFSTYESIVRAKKIFAAESAVVVTQEYHLTRALYLCEHFGIDAVGVPADPHTYPGETVRTVREWIARDKDLFYCLLNVPPKYLGDVIPVSGDGNLTND